MLIATVALVGALGFLYYKSADAALRKDVANDLEAVAELKARQIVDWREERFNAGLAVMKNPLIGEPVQRFLRGQADAVSTDRMTRWLQTIQERHLASRVILVDADGEVRLVFPADKTDFGPAAATAAKEAIASNQVTLSDLHRDKSSGKIQLDLIVPILAPEATPADSATSIGAVILELNPERFLYPLIQSWPTASPSAETLLVRREGDDVVYLNELRHRKGAALLLRFPMSKEDLPAARAVRGQTGLVEGADYRGVPVLTYVRDVPGANWFIVAKVDRQEAYAPLRLQTVMIGVITGLLLLAFSLSVGLIRRQRRVRFYREQAETGNEASRMATVVRESNDAITIQDFDGRIIAWNRGAELMYGYGEAEALAMNIELLTAPGKVVEQQNFIRRLREGEVVNSLETQRVTKDGRVLDIWMTVTKLVDDAGTPIGIASTERDITARKRAKEEVHKLNTELENRVVERTAQLEVANKELESFSYSVSHDLRAPLRHVQGYVDMLARDAGDHLSDKSQHYMKTIQDASREMGILIDDLLAFSRMGRAEMIETRVNLDSLGQDMVSNLKTTSIERNIVWKIQCLPDVQADPAMLKQVLTNLLGNAMKFTGTRDPAEIEIGSAGMEGGRIIFFVRDNGVGFDPQYTHKLFGVFQRLHRSDEFEGTGIGLANVRRIITRQGGRVWAEGKLNHGATFYFTLKPSSTSDATHGKENPT